MGDIHRLTLGDGPQRQAAPIPQRLGAGGTRVRTGAD
jgi:hypothetical protein